MSEKKWTRPDWIIIGFLFLLLLGWGPLYQGLIAPRLPAPPMPPAAVEPATNAVTALPPARETALRESPAVPERAPVAAVAEPEPPAPPAPALDLAPARQDPANLALLSNRLVRVGVSRIGGGIVFAEMLQFPQAPGADTPLMLDFAQSPALSLETDTASAVADFTAGRPFTVDVAADGRTARLTAGRPDGLWLERTLTLAEDDYRIEVEDRFVNGGAAPANLPAYQVHLGPLNEDPALRRGQQMPYLGIDSLSSSGGADVRHWGRGSFFGRSETLADLFLPVERRGGGCAMNKPALTRPLPVSIRHAVDDRTDWVAVKDKFFTQILTPAGGAAGMVLAGVRHVPPQEKASDPRSWSTAPVLSGLSAGLVLDPVEIGPGQSLTHKLSYYAGPKEYSRIEPMGNRIVEIMEFGRLRPICWLLLVCLKGLHAAIPNYGVAIILLTLLIRLVFWPITHKSTESMKRMQEIQPLIAGLRAKYRDKPQKLQEETMKLYKEHKVNPLGGCLPMLIQIPVFIALFNVLRSAVELRYAPFLWVVDLSEPEGLFSGLIPFLPGLGLNILPLIMTATSIWQSHLTPSGGDPNQQKMMLLMPIMMLFIFYNMPAALVLYWTANQVLMIGQLLWQKRSATARG